MIKEEIMLERLSQSKFRSSFKLKEKKKILIILTIKELIQ